VGTTAAIGARATIPAIFTTIASIETLKTLATGQALVKPGHRGSLSQQSVKKN